MPVCMYNTYEDCMTELPGKNVTVCTFRRSRPGAMEPWWATWCLPADSCAPVGKRWNSQMDMVTSLISNYEPNPSKYFLHLGDVQSLLDPVGERSHLMNFPVREGGAMLLSLSGGLDSYRVGARHGEARSHHIQGLSYGVANRRYFNRRYFNRSYDVKSGLIDFEENWRTLNSNPTIKTPNNPCRIANAWMILILLCLLCGWTPRQKP